MGTEATCPCLVSYQEGLRFCEVGSREEPGQILGISSETTVEVFLPLLPTSTGLPERSDQHSTRPLACPEGHWVWPLADSQANLTEPEKPKPYSSVFPNKTCARSDELCEVTEVARKGPLLYPPWFAIDYGFRYFRSDIIMDCAIAR